MVFLEHGLSDRVFIRTAQNRAIEERLNRCVNRAPCSVLMCHCLTRTVTMGFSRALSHVPESKGLSVKVIECLEPISKNGKLLTLA